MHASDQISSDVGTLYQHLDISLVVYVEQMIDGNNNNIGNSQVKTFLGRLPWSAIAKLKYSPFSKGENIKVFQIK
jgi:hypothetical protein